eukprot:s633_g7.t1
MALTMAVGCSRLLGALALFAWAVCSLQGCQGSGGESAPDSIKGTEEPSVFAHGTCVGPPQNPLRWGADYETADRINCFNRHYAEFAGSYKNTGFPEAMAAADAAGDMMTFYDSITGKPLFIAPKSRNWGDFDRETRREVVQENVRVLPDGEVVSVDGTHLGHNLPDSKGNRYCINLVSVAGMPPAS